MKQQEFTMHTDANKQSIIKNFDYSHTDMVELDKVKGKLEKKNTELSKLRAQGTEHGAVNIYHAH